MRTLTRLFAAGAGIVRARAANEFAFESCLEVSRAFKDAQMNLEVYATRFEAVLRCSGSFVKWCGVFRRRGAVGSQPQIFGGAEALAADLCMTYRAAHKLRHKLSRLVCPLTDEFAESSFRPSSTLGGMWWWVWLSAPASGTGTIEPSAPNIDKQGTK
jgi:hypothetical protein